MHTGANERAGLLGRDDGDGKVGLLHGVGHRDVLSAPVESARANS